MSSLKFALRPLVIAAALAAPPALMAETDTQASDNGQDMAKVQVESVSIPTVNARTNALTEAIANAQSGASLLRARLEEEKIRAELEDLMKSRRGGLDRSILTGAPTGMAMPEGEGDGGLDLGMSETFVEVIPPPHLLAIYGTGKRLVASIRFRSGVTQDIQVGEAIDGGFKVTSIQPNRVTLKRDDETFTLTTFPGRAAIAASAAPSKPTPGQPGNRFAAGMQPGGHNVIGR